VLSRRYRTSAGIFRREKFFLFACLSDLFASRFFEGEWTGKEVCENEIHSFVPPRMEEPGPGGKTPESQVVWIRPTSV
jgi:hypothetical protein